nr:immunoglobulin light chain junction region [Macaca mulatta]MOX18434.1 immunoglobulin light chain junction region [Macaca mulatta]MOX18924.1 immunoglobulin light chain junction region [Macaca mulatta]MOX20796.1 immunoglobulin light chain junction region [Macaca mulatta]MOX22473.1 immunoglobulin light chain junction region [Macaca mulatta]
DYYCLIWYNNAAFF